jgi:hypothetical protein
MALTPLSRDLFRDEDGLTAIVRNAGGEVTGVRFIRPRVYNMVFARLQN